MIFLVYKHYILSLNFLLRTAPSAKLRYSVVLQNSLPKLSSIFVSSSELQRLADAQIAEMFLYELYIARFNY